MNYEIIKNLGECTVKSRSILLIKTAGYLVSLGIVVIGLTLPLIGFRGYSTYFSYFVVGFCFIFLPITLFTLFVSSRIVRSIKKKTIKTQSNAIPTIKGMLIANKKLNLDETADLLSYNIKQLKLLIYNIVARGEIAGHLEGNEFILNEREGNLDKFVDALEREFAMWTKGEETKELKKD